MIILRESELSEIDEILTSHAIAFDTETTGLNTRKDKVIGFSLSNGRKHVYVSHLEWNNDESIINISYDKCKEILYRLVGKKLLTWNGAFDTSIVYSYFDIDLKDYIYDIMLLAHTVQEEQDFSLKGNAREQLGIFTNEQTVLKAELKRLGTKDYYKIPLSIMGPYAIADAKLTYKLFTHWQNKISDELQGLYNTEILPLYKDVIIPMQRIGVKIDKERMESDLISITYDIEVTHDKIQDLIKYYLLQFTAWFYDREYPLKSRGRIASLQKWNPKLYLKQVQRLAFEQDGGKYEFNISSDMHLRKLFFETLQLTPLSHTDGGLPRANLEFLESISDKYDFVPLMILYNKLLKIKGTYIERILEESEDGIFYPSYFMHRTTSGRLSGDAQQLPRPLESGNELLVKYTNAIRSYFISRPDRVFVDADYASLEPRCFASESGDKVLQDIFAKNDDFYSTIAIAVEGLTGSANKDSSEYLGKINKAARQKAKAYSLGLAYGMDDYKLHKDLNISQSEAKRLVDGYMNSFPNLANRMKVCKDSMLKTGTVKTKFGRVRHQLNIPPLFQKHGTSILNALDLYKKYEMVPSLYAVAKEDYHTVRHALNNSLNFGIQGLAAHITNRACIAIADRLKAESIDANIVAQIHDQIICECLIKDVDRVKIIVQDCMKNTTKIDVVLEAEPNIGTNFADSKG